VFDYNSVAATRINSSRTRSTMQYVHNMNRRSNFDRLPHQLTIERRSFNNDSRAFQTAVNLQQAFNATEYGNPRYVINVVNFKGQQQIDPA
jgi:hypothetical protein